MTTEERFTKIENTINAITEMQAKHEGAIRDLIVVSRSFLESQKETTSQMRELREAQHHTNQELREAQHHTDQELREVQREVAEIDRMLEKKLKDYAELAVDTEQKLNALIEVVDRIIRRENGQS